MNPPTSERLRVLVRAAARHDEHAWAEIVQTYDGLVRHVVRGFGFDAATAEDVTQATWCRLVQHLEGVRRPESLGAWLHRTARNESLRALRRAARETPTEADALDDLAGLDLPADDPGDEAAAGVLAWRAFAELRDDQRLLLRLVLLTEPRPSYQQISAALGRPIGSIGPTLGRCLLKLRSAMQRLAEDEAAGPAAMRHTTGVARSAPGGPSAGRHHAWGRPPQARAAA